MLRKLKQAVIGKPAQMSEAEKMSYFVNYKRAQRKQQLLRQESKVGGSLLGNIPAGHQRDFFCIDQYTWVWTEQWNDPQTKQPQRMVVRYEFQPNAVLKYVNDQPRGHVVGKELANLVKAMKAYAPAVATQVYGKKLQTAV